MATSSRADEAQRRIQKFASGALPLEHLAKVEEFVDFENSTRIGSGSLGDVLQVVDLASQQPLAIKVISRSKVKTRGVGEDRLQREVQVMSELKHPNVVRILDVLSGLQQMPSVNSDSEPPYLCIVMELIDASWPLSYEIRRSGAQPDLVTKVLPQLASGLNEIHSKGIVHRDVWSENVLINKDGHIVLVDLGCAESTAGPTVCRNLNIPYLSPQAARCEKQHPADDAWAAGLLVTEIATGLFVLQRLGRTDIPIHQVPSALSTAIVETQAIAGSLTGGLVEQLLHLEHERRPSMQEVLLRLEEVSDPGPSRAPVSRVRASTPMRAATPMRAIPGGSPLPLGRGDAPVAKLVACPSLESARFSLVQQPGPARSPLLQNGVSVAPVVAVPSSSRTQSVVRQTSQSESINASRMQQDDRWATPMSSRLSRNESFTAPPYSFQAPTYSFTAAPPYGVSILATPAGSSFQRMTPPRIRPVHASARLNSEDFYEKITSYQRSTSAVRASPFGESVAIVSSTPFIVVPPSTHGKRIPDPAGNANVYYPDPTGTRLPQETPRPTSRMAQSSSRSGLSLDLPVADVAWVGTPFPSHMYVEQAEWPATASHWKWGRNAESAKQANGNRFLQARPTAVTRQLTAPVIRQSSVSSQYEYGMIPPPSGVVVAVASEEAKVETTDPTRQSMRLRETSPLRESSSRTSLRQARTSEAQRTKAISRGPDVSPMPVRRNISPSKSARPSTASEAASNRFGDTTPQRAELRSEREKLQSYYMRQASEAGSRSRRAGSAPTVEVARAKANGSHHLRGSANLVDNANAFSANMRGEVADILKGIQKRVQAISKEVPPSRISRSTLTR